MCDDTWELLLLLLLLLLAMLPPPSPAPRRRGVHRDVFELRHRRRGRRFRAVCRASLLKKEGKREGMTFG